MPTVTSPYDESWNDSDRYAYHGNAWPKELYDHLREWGVDTDYFAPVSIDEGKVIWQQDAWDEPPYADFDTPTESIEVYPKYKCWGKGYGTNRHSTRNTESVKETG